MKKKIFFNDRYGLTEAVLSGRKTQTRRLILHSVIQKASEYQLQYFDATLDAISEKEAIEQIYFVERLTKLPYQVGEIVAVAQCYKSLFEEDCRRVKEGKPMRNVTIKNVSDHPGWTNKMFVRADQMPHRIRITNVRVERLQDISDKDCEKEGLRVFKDGFACFDDKKYIAKSNLFSTPREAYAALIDRISGKGTWESNPYVFVYDFELVK